MIVQNNDKIKKSGILIVVKNHMWTHVEHTKYFLRVSRRSIGKSGTV